MALNGYDEALGYYEEAIRLQPNPAAAERIRARLEGYRAGRPYHEAPASRLS